MEICGAAGLENLSIIAQLCLAYVESSGRTYRPRPASSSSDSRTCPPIRCPRSYSLRLSTSRSWFTNRALSDVLDGNRSLHRALDAKRGDVCRLSIGSRLPLTVHPWDVFSWQLFRKRNLPLISTRYMQGATRKLLLTSSSWATLFAAVRSDGFAITDEELELGLRSIAVRLGHISIRW